MDFRSVILEDPEKPKFYYVSLLLIIVYTPVLKENEKGDN